MEHHEESPAIPVQLTTTTVKIEPDSVWVKVEDSREDSGWACDNCDLPFPSYETLRAHVGCGLCLTQPALPCSELLSAETPDTEILAKYSHLDLKVPKLCLKRLRLFKCSGCSAEFLWESGLRRHEMACYKCKFCPAVFKTRSRLVAHDVNNHRGRGLAVACSICSKIFKGPRFLAIHRNASHGRARPKKSESSAIPTPTSGTRVTSTNTSEPTVYSPTFEASRPFSCQSCGLSFEAKRSYQKHMATHPVARHHCALSPLKFVEDLIDHCTMAHPKVELEAGKLLPEPEPEPDSSAAEPPHQCPRCGAKCESLSLFKKHFMKDHLLPTSSKLVPIQLLQTSETTSVVTYRRSRDGLRLFCPYCPLSYSHMGNFAFHVRAHYRTHLCLVCFRRFKTGVGLKEHRRVAHQSPKLALGTSDTFLECPYCARLIKGIQIFDQHVREHESSLKYAIPPRSHKFTKILLLEETGKDIAEQMSSRAQFTLVNVCRGTGPNGYLAVSHIEVRVNEACCDTGSGSRGPHILKRAAEPQFDIEDGYQSAKKSAVRNVQPSMPAAVNKIMSQAPVPTLASYHCETCHSKFETMQELKMHFIKGHPALDPINSVLAGLQPLVAGEMVKKLSYKV